MLHAQHTQEKTRTAAALLILGCVGLLLQIAVPLYLLTIDHYWLGMALLLSNVVTHNVDKYFKEKAEQARTR